MSVGNCKSVYSLNSTRTTCGENLNSFLYYHSYVKHQANLKKYLGYPHVVDNIVFDAPIVKKECNVKFYHFVPLDLVKCPIIVTISKGVHVHPPPPPTKTPSTIVKQFQQILNTDDCLNLTARKLMSSRP